MALADLLLVMQDGRIVDQGDPERVYTRPSTRFSATFMGENTLIEAEVTGVEGSLAMIKTPLGTLRLDRPGARLGKAAITVRPENMRLGAAPAGTVSFGAGTIAESVFQGSYRKAVVQSDSGQHIVLKLAADEPAGIGSRVELHAEPRHVGLLPG